MFIFVQLRARISYKWIKNDDIPKTNDHDVYAYRTNY